MKLLLTVLLLVIVCTQTVVAVDKFECRENPAYVVNRFAAYATEFDDSEQGLIDTIADEVLEQIDTIGTITVIGHSSLYGNTDMQTASELRAENVLDAISAAIDSRADEEQTDHLYYYYYGAGTDCPVTDNDTQINRSKNRRAEVYVYTRLPDDEDPEGDVDESEEDPVVDDEEDHRTWIEVLSASPPLSDNAASKCMARKLQKEGSDLAYLSAKGINKLLDRKETKKVKRAVKKAATNLGKQLESAYDKLLESAESVVKSPEERLWIKLDRSRRSLMAGINLLDAQANCTDKRIVAMRNFVVKRMKKKDSLYSCRPIKKRVKQMLASIGGQVNGCSAN